MGQGQASLLIPSLATAQQSHEHGWEGAGAAPRAVGQACGGREQLAAVHGPREGAGCEELVGGGENRVSASKAD